MRSLLAGLALAAVCLAQSDLRVSGPYQHSNLTVYLLHSQAKTSRIYLPLKEAIEQKKVVVHETQNVNELAIENISADTDVFVQGGDVVKGGQQDRVFTTDLILPPKSGRTPVATFCVEQGRWSKRAGEELRTFNASTDMVAHKDLKTAVKSGKDQTKVWDEVAKANMKVAGLVGASRGFALASPTSYQLNVERKEVAQKLDGYLKALNPLPVRHKDAVGFVYAVNGRFTGGEVYANPNLFTALWPKTIKAAAVEASGETVAKNAPQFKADDARAAVVTPKPVAKVESPNRRTRTAKAESDKLLMFESRDTAAGDAWLHRSYVAK